MKQVPKSINEFKRGDKITRIKPSKPVMKFGDQEMVNREFIGVPLIFVGIANGCIYLKPVMDKQQKEFASIFNIFGDLNSMIQNSMIHLELDLYEEGWSYYIDPNSLGEENDDDLSQSLSDLEKLKKEAIKSQNFEEAARIQKLINKRQND